MYGIGAMIDHQKHLGYARCLKCGWTFYSKKGHSIKYAEYPEDKAQQKATFQMPEFKVDAVVVGRSVSFLCEGCYQKTSVEEKRDYFEKVLKSMKVAGVDDFELKEMLDGVYKVMGVIEQ